MKLTYKQINIIRRNTPEFLKGFHYSFIEDFGHFQKSGANWSYLAGYIEVEGVRYLVVKVFGEII